MAGPKMHLLMAVMLLGAWSIPQGVSSLEPNYYAKTCPNVEEIVRKVVKEQINRTSETIPVTIHYYFQDCIGDGADASILTRTPLSNEAVYTVVKAKEALESVPECKGEVSCADIFTIANRDVIYMAGGPHFEVELGRFDSLPSPFSFSRKSSLHDGSSSSEMDAFLFMFASKGLNMTDFVALMGSHTVGHAHCKAFANRIYNFSATSPVDPTLNPQFAAHLQKLCPVNVDPSVRVPLDAVTPKVFDNQYYKNLMNGEGLLSVDQMLYSDDRTRAYVVDWAQNPQHFNDALSAAMVKMGRIGVLSSSNGNIRTHCDKYN
ncbi:hypothetical protein Droror1_Dr00009232 [Drosera rotundifolia]